MKKHLMNLFPKSDKNLQNRRFVALCALSATFVIFFAIIKAIVIINIKHLYLIVIVLLLLLFCFIFFILSICYLMFLAIYPYYKNHKLNKSNKLNGNKSGNIFGNNNKFNNDNIDKILFSSTTRYISKLYFRKSKNYNNNLLKFRRYMGTTNIDISNFINEIMKNLEMGARSYDKIQKDKKYIVNFFIFIFNFILLYIAMFIVVANFNQILKLIKILFDLKNNSSFSNINDIKSIISIPSISAIIALVTFIIKSFYGIRVYYKIHGKSKENYNKLYNFLFDLKVKLKYKNNDTNKKIGFRN